MKARIIYIQYFAVSLMSLLFVLLTIGTCAAEVYEYYLDAGQYEIEDTSDGYQQIKMDGFGQLLVPGKPRLPSKIFTIAVPPGARVSSVNVEGVDVLELDGTYQIRPGLSPLPGNGDEALIEKARVLYQENYDAVYGSDAPYPEKRGGMVSRGGYRKYNIVNVRFTPFEYLPKSGKLFFAPRAFVRIEYDREPLSGNEQDLLYENIPEVEDRARTILENYSDTMGWYPQPGAAAGEAAGGLYEFVIVTTEDLVDAVQPLVKWEKSKGRTVYVATISWINDNYSGADLQRRIRYFLRDKYPSDQWGILKVCLVGDLNDVPMRYCDVRKTGSTNTASLTPTDYYYAELTDMDSASWDDDWDGFFAELGDDTIDFITEVDVGRIPWSDPDIVEAICTRMAEYEYSNSTSWKKNVLLPEAFWDADTDNAVLANLMWTNFYNGAGYDRWRLYEYGPTWYSPYTRDATLTHTNVVDDWNADQFGSVVWSGHGNSTSTSYNAGHGGISFIQASDYTSLDDDYPSVIYSNSCSTAYPEVASLGRNMMRSRGVAFVGSTRTMWYMPEWDELSDGWGNTLAYLFASRSRYGGGYTIGMALTSSLRTMYTTYGWDSSEENERISMLEYVLYGNPDMWIRARPSLPNLDYFYRTGWDYPIVPRSAAGATSTACTVTSTLPGNTSDTYFNWTWENNGSIDSPSAQTRIFVDEDWIGYSAPSLSAGGSSYHINWNYGPTVSGGRHSVYYHLDYQEDVWEVSESDNFFGRQFVWSPLALVDDTPVSRGAPPHREAWASPYWYNNDGFSFAVGQEHPNKWWSAVGILPYASTADYDLRLWDIGDYTGSEGGFGGGYLEYSTNGGDVIDFVIVNDNQDSAGTYYAGTINNNESTSSYRIEEATSTKIYSGVNGPYTMPYSGVLDIFEFYIPDSGEEYGFILEQVSGTCDLGMSFYDDETTTASKSEYMTDGYSNSGGDGEDEYMQLTIPDYGYHSLVVWKSDSSDYSKVTTYYLKAGKCATPGTLSNPSPADGAVDVSVNADLDWADSSDTLYYDVWMRESGGTWTQLGETETSSWTLGTLEQATTYEWFVRAHNICGLSVYVYWDFTTEDTTAPLPNPMTWSIEPYEVGTSEIRMTATTASDPSTPIEYYHQFYSSPTGGAGGSHSGWVTSLSFSDTGLATNHQYGYRVFARDSKGNQTSPSAVSYDYTDIETPTGIVFGTVTASSIQARSANTPSNLTFDNSGLYIQNNTSGAVSGWKQNNNFWTSSGLTPNTSYAFRAIARNGDANQTPWCTAVSAITLANAPSAAAFSNITENSIQANWTANKNPSHTEYLCENVTAGTSSGWVASTSWVSSGLDCGTSYTFRVKARNSDKKETGWIALGSVFTLDCPDYCECDLNGDGSCNLMDWLMFREDWGAVNCNDPGVDCECDLNGDGSCNLMDWLMFREDWGRNDCP